jgi:hypothetical protein
MISFLTFGCAASRPSSALVANVLDRRPPGRFAHLISSATAAAPSSIVQLARALSAASCRNQDSRQPADVSAWNRSRRRVGDPKGVFGKPGVTDVCRGFLAMWEFDGPGRSTAISPIAEAFFRRLDPSGSSSKSPFGWLFRVAPGLTRAFTGTGSRCKGEAWSL